IYIPILWVAARTLIAANEPEAAALSAEILGGLGFLHSSIADPEIRAKWFDQPIPKELAELVGFESSQASDADQGRGVDLSETELGILRDLASGPTGSDKLPAEVAVKEDLEHLFEKLGVASQTEAIEYAIKAGVTWQ
ncbi:MAG: hypothetical protein WBZ45_02280, partial [Acidimicrobiia bacterium]